MVIWCVPTARKRRQQDTQVVTVEHEQQVGLQFSDVGEIVTLGLPLSNIRQRQVSAGFNGTDEDR
jgi:hypothetical protein